MRRINSVKCQVVTPSSITLVLLSLALLPATAFAAGRGGASPANSAYVYVGWVNGSTDFISGFAVAGDGSAQPVPDSPFNLPSNGLVTARSFVFGDDGQNIATYTLGSNGGLQQTSEVNALSHCVGCQGQIIYALNPDRAGQTLNTAISCGSCNSEVLPWSIGSNGQLTYIGSTGLPNGPAKWPGIMTFTADDRFAYTPIAESFGFLRRNSNGSVTWINLGQVQAPALQNPGLQVCNIDTVAASALGYVTLGWYGGGPGCNAGGYALANYTVAANGALNLVPDSGVTPEVYENAMAFDPTGSYLAVAGAFGQPSGSAAGIQIYKLQTNGTFVAVGAPLELSTAEPFQYAQWDSAGHIYALTQNCYQGCGTQTTGLFIFNFDGQNVTQAPGSPYVIANTSSLAVVPTR